MLVKEMRMWPFQVVVLLQDVLRHVGSGFEQHGFAALKSCGFSCPWYLLIFTEDWHSGVQRKKLLRSGLAFLAAGSSPPLSSTPRSSPLHYV